MLVLWNIGTTLILWESLVILRKEHDEQCQIRHMSQRLSSDSTVLCQADAFARELGYKDPLRAGLIKLQVSLQWLIIL